MDNPKWAFESEVAIHGQLDHENIVKLLHHFEEDTRYCILTVLCSRGTIHRHYEMCGPFSEKTSRYYAFQCSRALGYLQEREIVHRDLKPLNFFLDDKFNVKLGDFGLAVNLKETRYYVSKSGTVGYAAPEVFDSGRVGLEADVWSYGSTVYHIFLGRAPFDSTEETITENLKFPDNFKPGVKRFIEFVMKRRPEDRPKAPEIEAHEYFNDSTIFKPSMTELISMGSALKLTTKRFDQRAHNKALAEGLRRMALEEENMKMRLAEREQATKLENLGAL